MIKNHLTKIPVYSNSIDDITGIVQLRDILLHPESGLDEITKEVEFVPEQKSVESILEFFRKGHTDTAIVVDEYGGVAGLVCLEDIAEELFGSIGTKEEIDMIEQISRGCKINCVNGHRYVKLFYERNLLWPSRHRRKNANRNSSMN